MGTFFFLVASLLAAEKYFLWRGKGLLATAKNLDSDGYLALQKTSVYDLVYMTIYRETMLPWNPNQGWPLRGVLLGVELLVLPPKPPRNPPTCPAPLLDPIGSNKRES